MISKLPFSQENYDVVKTEALAVYNSFKPTKCQALGGQIVNFTAEGFNHILYKFKHERSKTDQFMRLKVIDLAQKLIGVTSTIQEKDQKIGMFPIKLNKKRTEISKIIKYWAFIAIIENKKIKVVIRKVGEGKIHFWSVIPNWTTTKNGEVILMDYTGSDLEND